MESDRFDALTKQMARAGTSRRRLLRALGGMVAGAVVTGRGAQAAAQAAPPVRTAEDFCETCRRNACLGCLGAGCPGCRDLRAEEQLLQEEELLLQEEEQAADCSQCGFACPSPTCPWTCCGLREEEQVLQEEEQSLGAPLGGSCGDCSCCDNVCSNCPLGCCFG